MSERDSLKHLQLIFHSVTKLSCLGRRDIHDGFLLIPAEINPVPQQRMDALVGSEKVASNLHCRHLGLSFNPFHQSLPMIWYLFFDNLVISKEHTHCVIKAFHHEIICWRSLLSDLERQYFIYFIGITMEKGRSRKIEGESKFKRPPKEEHINTFSLPYERRVDSVPYYSRMKRELKIKNYPYRSRPQNQNPDDLQDNQHQNEEEQMNVIPMAEYITDISIEPVFNQNKFVSFNPEQYPLNEHQKVKVVEEKFFPLQNYYNYIWAVKSKEEIFRLAEETQQKANEILKKQTRRKGGQYVESQEYNGQREPLIKQTRKISGPYESKVNSHGKYNRQMKNQGTHLAPVYRQFEGGLERDNPFEVKEKDREKILSLYASRYFMNQK